MASPVTVTGGADFRRSLGDGMECRIGFFFLHILNFNLIKYFFTFKSGLVYKDYLGRILFIGLKLS